MGNETWDDLPNLARAKDGHGDPKVFEPVDAVVLKELTAAGIKAEGFECLRGEVGTGGHDVPTKYFGTLCLWGFRRSWRYWVATGPGVPPDKAEVFHQAWGQQARVEGHCGCPSPLEWNRGFAVGMYHIDTLGGLKAFADLLRSIYIERPLGSLES